MGGWERKGGGWLIGLERSVLENWREIGLFDSLLNENRMKLKLSINNTYHII